MKGWRTLGFNAALAVLLALLHFATNVDWTQYVSPTTAMLIVAGVNAVLRAITTTPVGEKL